MASVRGRRACTRARGPSWRVASGGRALRPVQPVLGDVRLDGGWNEEPDGTPGGDEGPNGGGRDVETGDALQAHSASPRVADRPTGGLITKARGPRNAQIVNRP